MSEELAYSIHLGSDKNKTTKAKEIAKNNPSETTSFSNNGIQNSTQLSKVNKHNLRDYDKDNAVIHFDEISPHLHLVGVPIKDDYKKGMKKQPAKSKVFTKETLTKLQDEMRVCCIKSYNKVYSEHSLLKQKKKGRNQDINIKDMGDYRQIKKQQEKKEQKLLEANNQTKKIDDTRSVWLFKLLNISYKQKNMENEKVNYLIDMIKEMDKNNKLKLAIRINESRYTPIGYDREKMLKYFSNKLAEIDDEYKNFPVINSKYINFAMAKIMEMNITERNQVALYLFNSIN